MAHQSEYDFLFKVGDLGGLPASRAGPVPPPWPPR